MSYVYYNPNPERNLVGDCVIRAISKLTNKSWDSVFIGVCSTAFMLKDMPSSNRVWNYYLNSLGYFKTLLPNTCPDCYTVKDFCNEHEYGKYILALDGHVVAIENGNYYDTWDSGDEIPIFYWRKDK